MFQDLELPQAHHKAATLSSSPEGLKLAVRALGPLAGNAQDAAPYLGVDFNAGRTGRRRGGRRKRKERWL